MGLIPSTESSALAQGNFGTIKGRLVWGGATAPEPELIKPDKNPDVCSIRLTDHKLVVDPKTKGIEYGFAYIVNPKGKNPAAVKALLEKAPKVVIDQKKCEFVPYSTGLHKDQKLVFTSSDPTGHNVHYTGFINNANFALLPNGVSEVKLAADSRVTELACDIHPWMRGYIMIFDHPFFTVTKADGSFEITGVPAGEQKLVVWSKCVGYVTPGLKAGKAVEIKAGETTDVGNVVLDPSRVKSKKSDS
jgi:hypothetical protein